MDYYCITTTYRNNGPTTVQLTDSRYGLNSRPVSCHRAPSGMDIYTDWYTAREIRRDFPDIAKKYSF